MGKDNIFRHMKLEQQKEFGINIVNHSVRNEYNLTVSQYCAIDVISQRKKSNKKTSLFDISDFIGIDGNTTQNVMDKLEEKKFVICKDGYYYLNKKLSNSINNDQDYSEEFIDFWTIEVKGKVVNAWPGAKPKAQELYEKARKAGRSHNFIMTQRHWYFKLLEVETYRKKMIATRFLNIKSGELDQDFKGEYESVTKKKSKSIEQVSAVTMETFNREFS